MHHRLEPLGIGHQPLADLRGRLREEARILPELSVELLLGAAKPERVTNRLHPAFQGIHRGQRQGVNRLGADIERRLPPNQSPVGLEAPGVLTHPHGLRGLGSPGGVEIPDQRVDGGIDAALDGGRDPGLEGCPLIRRQRTDPVRAGERALQADPDMRPKKADDPIDLDGGSDDPPFRLGPHLGLEAAQPSRRRVQ